MSLIRKILTVSGFTLLSRIFGLVRDLMMARYLGVGMASDAFVIAFKLPNFFRRLFAEGAFSVGFVPLFSKALGKEITPESQKAAEAFASRVLGWLLPVLALMLLIMEVAMVPVMLGLTGGFADEGVAGAEKFNLVVELGRYTFPYLLLISLVSFFAGMLNAVERFAAAAFAPVLLNIVMILSLLLFNSSDIETARYLAGAVSVSGALQLLLLFIAAKRAGLKVSLPKPKLSEDVRQLLRVMAPAAVGAGIMQINLLADIIIAARLLPEGSVTWLFWADRLAQLPLGVIGIAVGTVLLPSISRLLSAGDSKGAVAQQNRSLEFSLLITLPAATALGMIAYPLIATLFERGAFIATDTQATSFALIAYAFGLPAYVIQKTLTPAYFARGDTKTPVIYATISLSANLILNLVLIRFMAHAGIAAATAIAAWLNILLLYGGLVRRGHFYIEKQTWINSGKYIVASAVMGGGLFFANGQLHHLFETDNWQRIATLASLVAFGGTLYFASAFALGAINLKQIRLSVSRKN